MRKVIDEETAKLENGLTVLASVGSTAPFVGLFGTVWGVYHALVGIGLPDHDGPGPGRGHSRGAGLQHLRAQQPRVPVAPGCVCP
ncbi:hypothetical protein G6F65_023196 [Rhizopus arrhizus]|nr:hypothetical protein G6F65_023196 [Rhizopus arrhizus]